MSTELDAAVELLDRSLAYTRGALADVGPGLLRRPTPCTRWDLGRLLAHMEDALDAFTEAAAGRVEVGAVPQTSTRVDALREKACALLGAWTAASRARDRVEVGDEALEAPLLVATAALEITVHGWDVAQATGRRTPIPDELALALLDVAGEVIDPADRGPRFAPPRAVSGAAGAEERLLAQTGRALGHMTEPLGAITGEPSSPRGLAS